jgi:hypothetical protein
MAHSAMGLNLGKYNTAPGPLMSRRAHAQKGKAPRPSPHSIKACRGVRGMRFRQNGMSSLSVPRLGSTGAAGVCSGSVWTWGAEAL